MKLDPKKTALLTLDLQNGILGFVPAAEAIISNAARAVEFARRKQFQIIHVGLGFSEGHPEIPDTESRFQRLKQNNLFVKGTASAEFHVLYFAPESWWSTSSASAHFRRTTLTWFFARGALRTWFSSEFQQVASLFLRSGGRPTWITAASS